MSPHLLVMPYTLRRFKFVNVFYIFHISYIVRIAKFHKIKFYFKFPSVNFMVFSFFPFKIHPIYLSTYIHVLHVLLCQNMYASYYLVLGTNDVVHIKNRITYFHQHSLIYVILIYYKGTIIYYANASSSIFFKFINLDILS